MSIMPLPLHTEHIIISLLNSTRNNKQSEKTSRQASPYYRHHMSPPTCVCLFPLTPLEIRTCFRPHRTLRQTLVNLKDHTPLQQRAGVVYRIPCGICPRVYVGQTCRMLDHRLKEHKRALTSGNLAQSAVTEHAAHESHVIGWKEAKVVDTHPRYHYRCALESWHIRLEITTMNRDDGSLPQAYNTLLNYPHLPHTPH